MIADLSGRVALVTGAAAGIGRAIAEVLAAQGAAVAVTDLDEPGARAVAAGLPRAVALRLDVTAPGDAEAAVAAATASLGPLDVLVCNAGVPADPSREVDTEEDWDRTFAVNVKGTVRTCEATLPGMLERGRGRIVTVASIAGHAARGTVGAYSASKAALLRYTKGLAATVAGRGITVNAVCPGAVWTPFQERDMAGVRERDASLADVPLQEIFLRRYAPVIPTARPQDPEEIGAAVAFLASDEARSITGQCLHVDGGAVIRD